MDDTRPVEHDAGDGADPCAAPDWIAANAAAKPSETQPGERMLACLRRRRPFGTRRRWCLPCWPITMDGAARDRPPAAQTIADRVGVKRSTVFDHLKHLEEDGFIHRQQSRGASRYILNWRLILSGPSRQLNDAKPSGASRQFSDPKPSGATALNRQDCSDSNRQDRPDTNRKEPELEPGSHWRRRREPASGRRRRQWREQRTGSAPRPASHREGSRRDGALFDASAQDPSQFRANRYAPARPGQAGTRRIP